MDDNKDYGGKEKKKQIGKKMESFKAYRGIEKVSRLKRKYDKLLKAAHTKYLSDLISDNSNTEQENIFPDHESENEFGERFKEYFMEKVFVIPKR